MAADGGIEGLLADLKTGGFKTPRFEPVRFRAHVTDWEPGEYPEVH